MECTLAAVHSDIQNLQGISAQTRISEEGLGDLEVQWQVIHKTLSER